MNPGVAGQRAASLHWPSVFQFAISGLTLSVLWSFAAFSLLGNFVPGVPEQDAALGSVWVTAFGYFFFGLLLLPSAVLSLRRILGHPARELRIPEGRFGLSILLFPIALIAGNWLLSNDHPGWVTPLHIFVILLTVGWLLWLALRSIRPGSGQRAWGALAAGMVLTPLFAVILEVIGAIFLFVILAIYVGVNPELAGALERVGSLADRLNPNVELIVQNLRPFLDDPFILVLTLTGLGVVVPLIEELFKPLGVMLLLGRRLTPAQGFALGAICGAGYALAENLMLGAGGEGWALISIGRFGTSAMHIFTAALSGYALVRAKNERRWLQLFGIYLFNVALHGLWNAMVVFTSLAVVSGESGLVPAGAILLALPTLLLVALGSVFFLRRMNRGLTGMYTSRISTAPPKLENL